MNDHLQALLAGRQYSEELKEEAAMRVVFGGEDPHEVIRILDIHNIYALNNWVTAYNGGNGQTDHPSPVQNDHHRTMQIDHLPPV